MSIYAFNQEKTVVGAFSMIVKCYASLLFVKVWYPIKMFDALTPCIAREQNGITFVLNTFGMTTNFSSFIVQKCIAI